MATLRELWRPVEEAPKGGRRVFAFTKYAEYRVVRWLSDKGAIPNGAWIDDGDNPGFYTFAVITDDPPLEVVEAGHDRCPVPLHEDDIDAWLSLDPKDLPSLYAILDRHVRPFKKDGDDS